MSDTTDRDRRSDAESRRRRSGTGIRRGGNGRSSFGARTYYGYGSSYSSRRETRDQGDSPTPPIRPIILAKPQSERTSARELITDNHEVAEIASSKPERPITLLRSREEVTHSEPSPASPVGDSKSVVHVLKPSSHLTKTDTSGLHIENTADVKHRVRIIDDIQQWCDINIEPLLLDQPDFLVIGALGLHGSGKSSLLSYLCKSPSWESNESLVFPAERREDIVAASHMTNGVDMYVTSDRVIYIDTQPVLSSSVLDSSLQTAAKYNLEYISPENSVEIQSLQLAAFLMNVCHVILIVEDWFTDINLLNFISTAEMLKPAISTSDSTSTSSTHNIDYCPHIVFIQNKAPADYFTVDTYRRIEDTIGQFFKQSSLKHSGTVSLAKSRCITGINKQNVKGDVNLFILPNFNNEKEDVNSNEHVYRGHPSFKSLLTSLRNQLLGVPRLQITHASLTERNWFNYAARMWDQIKKSQIISEYNRFLP